MEADTSRLATETVCSSSDQGATCLQRVGVASGASFILHLVLFLTPAHDVPTKSNVA